MKRMVSLISEQVLPNLIPLNEPATRPDVLHGIFTPTDANMIRRWDNLKTVIAVQFPNMRTEDVPIKDAYDAQAIQEQCANLIEDHPDDDWALNMTGGTKLMSAPAVEVFHRNGRKVYYVESPKNRTLEIHPDWTVVPLAFEETVDLKTYFQLHGYEVEVGEPLTKQERTVYRQLQKLDWNVWPSVALTTQGRRVNEYDAVGIRFYQCSFFECKRFSDPQERRDKEEKKERIKNDLFKLFQMRQDFGGPFGRSYWVFSGSYQLSSDQEERIRAFRITLILNSQIGEISQNPAKFGLPQLTPRVSVAKS